MCGYNFILSAEERKDISPLIHSMNKNIEWRGPDGAGVHFEKNMAFGHVRLAIQDVSEHGHQPFVSQAQDYCLLFNGEIYNHFQLREQYLTTVAFTGTSDTETLFQMLINYGLEKTLPLLEGMFSFTFFNKATNELWVARDAFGEKPLYYGVNNQLFFITSDLNSVKNKDYFNFDIDKNALASYFRFSYIPTPYSIYKNVRKLEAGSFFKISLDTFDLNERVFFEQLAIGKHYHVPKHTENIDLNYQEAKNKLNELVIDSVKLRAISDVPLGSFLSGGVDSSLVSAVLQKNSPVNIDTFSLGFDDKSCDESVFARKVAEHLKTNHNEIIVNEKDLLDIIPLLSTMFSEPFADSSQLPTFLVSQFARTKVTVCLSGDAGDELFCGYNRYFYTVKVMEMFIHKPRWIKVLVANIIQILPLHSLESFYNYIRHLLPQKMNVTMLALKLEKASEVLKVTGYSDFFLRTLSHSKTPNDLVLGGSEYMTEAHLISEDDFTRYGVENSMMRLDQKMYLSDDILTKVDRAAMFSSLEARVPFLDRKIVDFAAQLPLSYKTDGAKGKLILRDVLYDYVPKELIERPKQGFAIPLKKWITTELRDWAEALLSVESLEKSGVLNVNNIRSLWENHLSGSQSNEYVLWDILMFQSWFEQVNK
ncbi:MAG: asparagine synthase (glutamine-hydrolyzing) [Glaciecola sp.]|jgi:asparagine synthase (glutamine-hydrolysing)